jgi:hypothetical protein
VALSLELKAKIIPLPREPRLNGPKARAFSWPRAEIGKNRCDTELYTHVFQSGLRYLRFFGNLLL